MKNVLLATTALVAMAGAASAEISWSGSADIGYNDDINGGLFYDATFDVKGTFDLGDGYAATISFGSDLDTSGPVGATPWAGVSDTRFDSFPTIEITSPFGSLKGGDLDDKGASEYFYKDRDGMAADVENHDSTTRFDWRALVEFGNYGLAVGGEGDGTGNIDGLSVGAGATFGNFTLGLAYDEADTTHTGTNSAVSLDTTFGAATIGLSYIAGSAENSVGVAVGYEVSSDLSFDAYYANNSVSADEYGVSVAYTTGAIGLDAYYEGVSGAADTYGVDVSYDISSDLIAYAGYKDAAGTAQYYVGATYEINENLSTTVSYSDGDEVSGPEFKDGVSLFISASF